jgi:serine/threonine protein kinase
MIQVSPSFLKAETPLAEGGEGIIYRYQGKILKVYKNVPAVDIKEKEQKVKLLLQKKLPPNCVGPVDIATDSSGKFIGYLMNEVQGINFKMLTNKKYVRVNNINVSQVLDMLLQIRDTLSSLHNQNIFIGDLNDQNILFDKTFKIWFIDVDSWTVDMIQCKVAMDEFLDPLFNGKFSSQTDVFAFSVMLFKSLTRMHPYGGSMIPDMGLVERIKKRISIIDNSNVTIPAVATNYRFISPSLLSELKEIYEKDKRSMITDTLNQFKDSLKWCDTHGDFYFSKFTDCPLCNMLAKVVTAPQKVGTSDQIAYVVLSSGKNVRIWFDVHTYLGTANMIHHIPSGKQVVNVPNTLCYFMSDGRNIYVTDDEIILWNNFAIIKKTRGSSVRVIKDKIYYVSPKNELIELTVTNSGNNETKIADVSFRNYFDIKDSNNYLICNIFDTMKVINIDGYNHVINNDSKVREYGIHRDPVSGQWLFIYYDNHSKFHTYVFEKNKVIFENHDIRYSANLGNLCFFATNVFSPSNGAIRGFSYSKNAYKDFPCQVINDDSKLIRTGNKFTVINEKEIYEVG